MCQILSDATLLFSYLPISSTYYPSTTTAPSPIHLATPFYPCTHPCTYTCTYTSYTCTYPCTDPCTYPCTNPYNLHLPCHLSTCPMQHSCTTRHPPTCHLSLRCPPRPPLHLHCILIAIAAGPTANSPILKSNSTAGRNASSD